MSELLVHGARDGETVTAISPADAGWEHVGFEVLRPSAVVRRVEPNREICVVVVSGTCDVRAGAVEFTEVGGRETPFSGPPDAVYVPAGVEIEIDPQGSLEVAICSAPASPGGDVARIAPGAIAVEHRGEGAFARHVQAILMDGDVGAQSLLVCEVITPAGNWSSFPPHKHDRDELPTESLLEETYYHRISDRAGFGLQRVYTADRDLDETIAFGDRDTVLVPRGYHVVSAPPGYDLYYLNVMAGPRRAWAIAEDPDHAWIAAGR